MGAAAAKMSGLGEMQSNIAGLKKAIEAIKGMAKQLEDKGKFLTEGISNAKQSKETIEKQVGGLTGSIDTLKKMGDGIGGNLQGVQSLLGKLNPSA